MTNVYERLNHLIDTMTSYEIDRKENKRKLSLLYSALRVDTKVESFETIFTFNAINLMGVSLQHDTLGMLHEKKYVQMLAIVPRTPHYRRNKNISLGYYGKAQTVDKKTLALIIEFVLRWRYEKTFLSLEQNKKLVEQFKVLFDD